MYSNRNMSTIRRINVLTRILASQKDAIQRNLVRALSVDGKIKIDDVEREIKTPRNREYVPQKYIRVNETGTLELSQTALHHLRWMLQKDNLGQDMFLLGRPGPLRRSVAMQYLELTQRETEYISLSRDTTESDLKQRREIQQGTAAYFDQSAVRAAIEGRVLVIEGVEKAERNVLPVLNNLLENREMHLEDGRFLIPAERYDKLLREHGKQELERWGLIRVSEDFRVIALGLPVPKYRGAPLDPPLRSRFQARDVTGYSYQENFKELRDFAPNAKSDDITKILSFGTAILNTDSSKTQLPDFPSENLTNLAKILNHNPNVSIYNLIYRLYPYRLLSSKESHENILTMMEGLKIKVDDTKKVRITEIVDTAEQDLMKSVTIESGSILKKSVTINVPGGHGRKNDQIEKFIPTEYQSNILADIIQSHGVGDYCLVGPKGSGKSAIIFELSRLLDQTFEPMVLYQDMTARDLIQQRTTKPNGDTIWRDSPLVRAARHGNIAILDGIHRIHHSTISILHRLVHDREVQLYDGRRLIRHDKYDDLLASGSSVEELESKGILRIHPAFRIVALAEPPTFDKVQTNWLTPEMLSLFMFHEIRNLSKAEEIEIMTKLYGTPSVHMDKIIDLSHFLRDARDPILKNLSSTLSTRQLLRIAHRMSKYECDSHEMIQRAFLSKFLPTLPRQALETVLDRFDIRPAEISHKAVDINVGNGLLTIGNTKTDIYKTTALTKVPDILFYDVPQHIRLLEHLLQDFLIGNHLLLVGNQGVGKNKIADRLLQLMNRPREYIQLHRDTTVQTLTLQPTVRDGVVVYEDSPLVRAVKHGHILVVDEADKAPTHVTCILKTLVENGEMNLSDGRKILSKFSGIPEDPRFIKTHPDFRMIVLANRPGFPFLGNDFFASLGDLFSCHAVDNPSTDSEIFLLQQYGPDVPHEIIRKLVVAFDELRTMADVGQLAYPYSTREVVNIVKHLQKFPDEDMVELIGNVLDFDRYTPESLEMVTAVLQKHGLSIEAYAKNELASIRRRKEIQLTVERVSGLNVSAPKHGKIDPKNEPHVGGNTWAGGSGGRDTAGLGGKGGPYRLDAGHKVHQLSDDEKNDIPDEVKKAAFEMNRKAFADKLKEIQMSEYDHKVYEEYSVPVRKQVQQLRVVLNSLQAKSKERHWQKHQTVGELDDAKLIEGIIGERNIYRKRADIDPEPGQPQEKPKRLKLVVDVSGSMYRFNGYDGRLDRELEAVVLVMEAFQGFETRVEYDVIGHSGESYNIPFVDPKKPPSDDKMRLATIKMMHAHSQFCWSGDHTLDATRFAVDEIAKEDCDEAIVIVLSDANLSRYSISPRKLAEMLTKQEPKVQAYAIFIGSLGEEAAIISKEMPAGRSFVCMDLAELPSILKQIFSSSVLRNIS